MDDFLFLKISLLVFDAYQQGLIDGLKLAYEKTAGEKWQE